MEGSSLALFSRIEQNIEEIESFVQQIRKKHTRILSSPFQDEADYVELDKLMAKVQSSSSQTWALLKAAKQNRPQGNSMKRISIRMENVQINSLNQRFLDVLAEYSSVQTEFRDRRKKLLRRQLEITGQKVNDDELDRMLEENKAVFTQDYIIQVERTREDLTDAQKRCSQIFKIENSLRELDDMLLSLSILINSQGEILDSVEQHVMEASEDVKDGNKKIGKAVKKKIKIKKVKIAIAASLLLIVGFVIVLVLLIS